MKKSLLVLLCIISVNSFAFPRGNDLYPSCYHLEDQIKNVNTQKELLEFTEKATYCIATASTAFDDITIVSYSLAMSAKTAACIEEYYGFSEFKASQVLDMTVKYLKDHPEYRNYRIGEVVLCMLREKYPVPDKCKKIS